MKKKALRDFLVASGMALLATLPGQAAAHPHIFIDGGIDFHFEGGKLTRLRVTWIYDPFYSLYLLQDEGIDSDGDGVLTEEEKARLAARETNWVEDYDGDSFLWQNEARIGLSRPVDATGDLVDGQVTIIFDRLLDAPVEPGDGLVAKAFDPSYYVQYAVTKPPRVIGAAPCLAEVHPFVAEGALGALQADLSALGRDETPEMPNIGALFADQIMLVCD